MVLYSILSPQFISIYITTIQAVYYMLEPESPKNKNLERIVQDLKGILMLMI